MPIKWNALAVSNALDEIEVKVAKAAVPLSELVSLAELAETLPNLPEYVRGPLRALVADTKRAVEKFREDIERIRNDIPAGAIERESLKNRMAFDS